MKRFRDEFAVSSLSDDDIAALHREKTAHYADLVVSGMVALRPGVAALIEEARAAGIRLAVATTTNAPNVEALIRATLDKPADDVFEIIAAGDEVLAKKPAPDVFLLALKRLGIKAERAIAIEDSANGLCSAKAASLQVVVTPSRYTVHEDFSSANWVIPSLERADRPSKLRFR